MCIFTLFLAIWSASAGDSARESLNSRFQKAIESSLSYKVVLEDLLGEGEGAWDSDPRTPTDTVNCMIWLQLVLAEVYGEGSKDKAAALDRIRYYNGQVAFALRKHYTDHWLAVEPEPLRKVNISSCTFPYYTHVKLNPEEFTRSRDFQCPLYKMNQNEFDIQFAHGDGILKCANKLPPGYYILFAVPSDTYSKMYLTKSGPMGLVHAMILKTTSPMKLYHASTSDGHVLEENPEKFFERMKNLHQGYAVYDLNPNWDFKKKVLPDPESKRLLACEAKLPKPGSASENKTSQKNSNSKKEK